MEIPQEDLQAGRIAYAGYCATSGGKSLVTGAPLPSFDDQRESIKLAWVNAARAVRNLPLLGIEEVV